MGSADSPQTDIPAKDGVLVWNESGGTISEGAVVYISGARGRYLTIAKAAYNQANLGALWIVEHDIPNNRKGKILPWRHRINLNTSGSAVGDPVYLSTAGGYTTSAPATAIRVGTVTAVSATDGSILFAPQAERISGAVSDSVTNALPRLISCEVDHEDVNVDELSEGGFFLVSLPAKAVVIGAWFHLREAFAGDGISAVTFDFGLYHPSFGREDFAGGENVFTGAYIGHHYFYDNTSDEVFGAGKATVFVCDEEVPIVWGLTTVDANLSSLTSGNLIAYVLYIPTPLGDTIADPLE